MKKISLFLIFLFFVLKAAPVRAEDILKNKFGVHILEPHDLERAAELVNSSGGDWGYVTVVIRRDDQNLQKWQSFFDQCREKHLIPLVRIATSQEDNVWRKPSIPELHSWVDFLNSLNWPVKTRYVIVYNEPNQAKEWGGKVNPAEYAQILKETVTLFKGKNSNFFILNSGFDLAAPNSATTMDSQRFLEEMDKEIPGIFKLIDGWASHSYPNHGFVGSPQDFGKASIRGYQWELNILETRFGIQNIPIYITETGWPHSLKSSSAFNYLYDPNTTANFIKQAYSSLWLTDERVKAVTPFILNYPNFPFAHFSWIDENGQPYPQFETIKSMNKEKNKPEQETKWQIISVNYPKIMPTGFSSRGKIILKNTGQSIWGENELIIKAKQGQIFTTDLLLSEKMTKPQETLEVNFQIKTGENHGNFSFDWEGFEEDFPIRVIKLPIHEPIRQSTLGKIILPLLEKWYNLFGK